MSNLERISVVIPAHNEGVRIYEMIAETVRVLSRMNTEYEILVVNDGSTDDTLFEIQRAAQDFENVSVLNLPHNIGKGNALQRGFWKTTSDTICFIDADLDLHPSHIESLKKIMEEKDADIVIGSKRHPDSNLDYPLYRKIFSAIYHFMVLILFKLPVKDTQTGIKLFKREALSKTFPRILCKQYAMDLELLAVANRLGFSIVEAPINLTFQGKFGRIRWQDIRNIIVDTLAIFYRMYFLRYYDSSLRPPAEIEPKVSIIIPTKKVDAYTMECLNKCSILDYKNYEVLLVPDEEIEIRPELTVLFSELKIIPSGHVNLSKKRNIALRNCTGEFIAFIESNAYPDALWLKNAVSYFNDEEVAAVCGPALTAPGDDIRQRASGLIYTSSLVSANTVFRFTPRAMRQVNDHPLYNLIIRRSELDSECAFPEEFSPGEDTVLCLRLTKNKGKKILYVPNVLVYRHLKPLFLPHLKEVLSYAMQRGYFARKFPETSRMLKYFVPSILVLWLVIGLIPAVFIKPVLYTYLAVLGLYLLLCALSSVKSLEPLVNIFIFPGIILTNLTYGIGFLLGLFSKEPNKC